ncbi:MAG: hypothetical protein ABIJ57_07010, partial [Pseudomonadota bacterium]
MQGGLFYSPAAWKEQPWFGLVCAVGPLSRRFFRFGDLVMVSHEGGRKRTWYHRPMGKIVHRDSNYEIQDPDSPKIILANGGDKWASLCPSDVIFRVKRHGDEEQPGFHPISRRIYVRHDERPRKAGNLIDPNYRYKPPYSATVREVAPDVEL